MQPCILWRISAIVSLGCPVTRLPYQQLRLIGQVPTSRLTGKHQSPLPLRERSARGARRVRGFHEETTFFIVMDKHDDQFNPMGAVTAS